MNDGAQRRWDGRDAGDLGSLDRARAIAILPLAAIEQHGPHLPLDVDLRIAEGVLDAALARLAPEPPLVVLPSQDVGYSVEHKRYPGTKSKPPGELIQEWCDLGAAAAGAGIGKLVMFNCHGGNSEVMRIVARELRVRHRMLAVAASWYRLVQLDDLVPAEELAHGIHGGMVETSVMLHLAPESVHMSQAADFKPASLEMAETFKHLTASGPVAFGWETQDLHLSGAVGNAAAATPELGREIVERAVAGLVELIEDVDRFDLDRLKDVD